MRRWFPLLTLALALSAGAQDPSTEAPDASATARRERVYARVGDRAVTVGQIEDAIAAQTPFQRMRYRDDPAKLRELANRLVELELLAGAARARHLEATPRVRESFESNLVQLLMRRVIDSRISPQSIPEGDVAAYFAAHPDEFSRPEMVRASHVLLATEAEATALVEQCRRMDLAAFHQFARDKSLDTETKQSGGDLRYFTRDGRPIGQSGRPIDGALVEAAFAIGEAGECSSQPVRVGDKFSVLMRTGHRAADTMTLEVANDSIRRRLWRERRDQALDRLVTEIRSRVRVTQRNELVRWVEIPPPDPSELGQHRHGDEAEPSHAPPPRGAMR